MDCNLRCRYCYYECPNRANMGVLLSLADVRSILTFFASTAQRKEVPIIWHGGEPLLPGVDYYKEIVAIENQIAQEKGVCFDNRIQTNGTLINAEWVEFFTKQKFKVGVSIDGPEQVNDSYRVDNSGNGSFKETLRGITLSQEAGLRVGALAVLTNISVGKARETFEFFINHHIYGFRVKQCYEIDSKTQKPTYFSIDAKQYGNFLIDLFDTWIDNNDDKVRCGPVDDYLRGILGKEIRQCVFKRMCHTYIGIWPNGDIFQCEFGGENQAFFGNFNKEPLGKILENQKAFWFSQKVKAVKSVCAECCWYNICNGGCARYDIGLNRKTNVFCTANKMILGHIKTYISK